MGMGDLILTLNAGSSSIKLALFEAGAGPELMARGQVEGLGAKPRLTAIDAEGRPLIDRLLDPTEGAGHAPALGAVLGFVGSAFAGRSIAAVGHRVVHGGLAYTLPVAIDDTVVAGLEALKPLAPLHQPHNIAGIRAARAAFPQALQVACFDTAFHRQHPWVDDTFALPRRLYEEGVRRYGFHGLSYEYMAVVLAERHGEAACGRTLVAHLGSGASLCAMHGLQSQATTMGFSALDGLMMGTRTGALDPGAVLYLMEVEKLTLEQVGHILYHESGLLGVSGISSDPRELLAREATEPRAALALQLYVRRIVREIGALTSVLGGLDMLVFTAGIGEHSVALRQRICSELGWLGVDIDALANATDAPLISTATSRVRVAVEPTNEEWIAARYAQRLLGTAAIDPS